MPDLIFLLAVHNHQPVGNFLDIFKKAFRDCYEPFLLALSGRPAIKFTLHFSGPLWEHMESREKRCWEMVKEMAARRQVELLGGGFFEPILSIVPEEDRLGQLRMMNDFLRENFGVSPRGVWLTERVWEPTLPATLARAGIQYTLLDEEHFHYAGIQDLFKPYITEDQGFSLILFPVSKKLRYLIPFRPLAEVKACFEEIAAAGGTAILGDDGEKFGLWPGTHRWVYEEGWLEGFLDYLDTGGIRTLTCGEYLDSRPDLGRAYLPPASYEEMMEWVLPPDDYERFRKLKQETPPEARRFLRGGFFREYFLKYPEANNLHKRMLLVSKEVSQNPSPEAAAELYRGQGNDPYWHGIFGGLYLPHLRESAYHHLLEAEKKAGIGPGWRRLDFDLDGREELLYRSETFNVLLKPSSGGSLVEFDDRLLSRNLSDVLSRREESYHRQKKAEPGEGKSIHELAKKLPDGAEALLRADWHPRYSLLDHFFHPGTSEDGFRRLDYGEQGDFVNQEYSALISPADVILLRRGHVWVEQERAPVEVTKRLRPDPGGVLIGYEITNQAKREVEFFFGVEWNFCLLPEEWELRKDSLRLLAGRWVLEFSPQPGVWSFPLETLSQSEEGYDIIRQGFCFLPHWKFSLAEGQKFNLRFKLRGGNER